MWLWHHMHVYRVLCTVHVDWTFIQAFSTTFWIKKPLNHGVLFQVLTMQPVQSCSSVSLEISHDIYMCTVETRKCKVIVSGLSRFVLITRSQQSAHNYDLVMCAHVQISASIVLLTIHRSKNSRVACHSRLRMASCGSCCWWPSAAIRPQ